MEDESCHQATSKRGMHVSGPATTEQTPAAEVTSRPKWFHFRARILLIIPAALLVVAAIYGPRQQKQRNALLALKEMKAQVRTEPLLLPGVGQVFGDEYAQEIVGVYIRNPDLKDTDLNAISGLRTLQKLELAGSKVSANGLKHLTGLPNLYILHLADTDVTDDGLVHLSELHNLGILSLDNTKITDAGLASLAPLKRLERLFMNGTNVTDDGIAHIGKLTSLKEFSCANTGLTDDCLKHLTGLKNLEVLKLYNTKITREALEDLRNELPNCAIWEPDE